MGDESMVLSGVHNFINGQALYAGAWRAKDDHSQESRAPLSARVDAVAASSAADSMTETICMVGEDGDEIRGMVSDLCPHFWEPVFERGEGDRSFILAILICLNVEWHW